MDFLVFSHVWGVRCYAAWWIQDKWKTLVHTAQIAPQQRRGEPVPQELLDRVMQAHSLWTEQLRTERDER